MTGSRIFISYRRQGDAGTAGRLHDRLANRFGARRVFMDVSGIPLGIEFDAYLNAEVAACDAFIAVIGKGWLAQVERLFDENDFVRVEIAAALARPRIPIIPVLVDGVVMPAAEDLPEQLQPLVRRNGLKIEHDQFAAVIDGRLVDELRLTLGRPSWVRGRPVVSGAVTLALVGGLGTFLLANWAGDIEPGVDGAPRASGSGAGEQRPTVAIDLDGELEAKLRAHVAGLTEEQKLRRLFGLFVRVLGSDGDVESLGQPRGRPE